MASKYFNIYVRLRDGIISGAFPAGTKLPSKRTLAATHGVSLATVEHALEMLENEGYTEARERSGFFVIYRASARPDAASEETVTPRREDFPLAREPLPTPAEKYGSFPFSVWAKAYRAVLSEKGESLFEKTENFGAPELRREIAAYLSRSRGINTDPARVAVGAGSEYLYNLLIPALGRDRVFAAETPSYEKIEAVYRSAGVDYELLRLGGDGIMSSELERTRASVLHVTPYGSFPSGVTASASKKHEYLRWLDRGGRFIIEDDYASEFSPRSLPAETLYSLDGGRRVIYINTFSVTLAPSARVAYMLIPEGLYGQFVERIGAYSCTVPATEQFVLARLLANGDFERHLGRVRRALTAGRRC